MIYVDSRMLIDAFESDPLFGSQARAALAGEPGARFAISPLVKFECLVGPMRTGNLVLRRYYEEGLKQFAQLSMPEDVYLLGAELRVGCRAPCSFRPQAA